MDTKKDNVAGLLAPCFLNEAETGNTPQEQRGRGIPISTPLIIERHPFTPKYLIILFRDKNIFNNPATPNPNKRKGDISTKRVNAEIIISLMNFIT